MGKRRRVASSTARSRLSSSRITIVLRSENSTITQRHLGWLLASAVAHRHSSHLTISRRQSDHRYTVFSVHTSAPSISESPPYRHVASSMTQRYGPYFRFSFLQCRDRGHRYGILANVPQNLPVPWKCQKCTQELEAVRQCKGCGHSICQKCFAHSPNRTGEAADFSKDLR
jgi:hypothetical protein